jgi:hypothetical protein
MEWGEIVIYVLSFIIATFGAKWGLKKIIMSSSRWAKALNPVAKEMDEALTAIGLAGEDGNLDSAEMRKIFTESKDVWEAIGKVKDAANPPPEQEGE